ncbi:hypothetical protein ACIQCD_21960 [Streptomyces sp. NPDC093250]|uniref:hypothetical protein n=1 Tax=unclassified Streptomyces TaxID=2593676 RepID=UPI0033C1FD17
MGTSYPTSAVDGLDFLDHDVLRGTELAVPSPEERRYVTPHGGVRSALPFAYGSPIRPPR